MQNWQERDGVQSESESGSRYVSHSQRARARARGGGGGEGGGRGRGKGSRRGGVIQASFIAMNERWTLGATARRGVELVPEREDTDS